MNPNGHYRETFPMPMDPTLRPLSDAYTYPSQAPLNSQGPPSPTEMKTPSGTSRPFESYSPRVFTSCPTKEIPLKVRPQIPESSFYRDYCNKRHEYQSSEVDLQLQTEIHRILADFEIQNLSDPHTSSTASKRKRASSEQLRVLKQIFDYTFFPSTKLRNELSRVLGMTPRAVQVWFQNKRQSWKSRKGKSPSSKRSISPYSVQNPSSTRLSSPPILPSLLNDGFTVGCMSTTCTASKVLPAEKEGVPSGDPILGSDYLRRHSLSLQQEHVSRLEPLAPLRTPDTTSRSQTFEIVQAPFRHDSKLPSLVEMGIESPSSQFSSMSYSNQLRPIQKNMTSK